MEDSRKHRLGIPIYLIILFSQAILIHAIGYDCEWGLGEHVRRFVRVPEDASLGFVAFLVNVSRPDLLKLRPLKVGIEGLLTPVEKGGVGMVVVSSSLNQLVTAEEEGSSVLKFALFCGENPVSQQVTVYIDDVNNHKPIFVDRNVSIVVDEMTPTGLVILPEIRVLDGDKPNTANSEIEMQLESQVSSFFSEEVTLGKEFPKTLGKRTQVKLPRASFGDRANKDNATDSSRRGKAASLDDYFAMTNHKKGEITLVKSLDFDDGPRHFYLKIIAKDMGESPMTSSTWIHIQVKDSDDLDPLFTSSLYTASVYEHPGPDTGEVIKQKIDTLPGPIEAHDGDVGINTTLEYGIVTGEASHYFSIDQATGELFLIKHLDRELLRENSLTVHLLTRQVDNPGREGSAGVKVTVRDVNDHLPYFENDMYAISIVENLPAGFSVVQVSAYDPDMGENGEFTYYVKRNSTPLAVNPETGWLTVSDKSILDREIAQDLSLEVCTKQKTPLVYVSKDQVTEVPRFETAKRPSIKSDQTPNFSHNVYTTEIIDTSRSEIEEESSLSPDQTPLPPTAITVQSISPLVRSLPPSALLRERIQRGMETSPIDSSRVSRSKIPSPEESFGKLLASRRILSQQADPETPTKRIAKRDTKITRGFRDKNGRFVPIHYLQRNGTSDSPCASIKLTLLDANDNNPVFVPNNVYEFTIYEDKEVGELIGTVKAMDKDSGENGVVRYRIQSQTKGNSKLPVDYFEINSKTGIIKVKSPGSQGHVTLFVEAADSPSSVSETRTSLAVVSINIKSNNAFEPEFLGAPYEFWVGAEAPIGTSVGQVRVSELDSNKIIFDMFHSYAEEVPFGIEETSGIVAVTKSLQDFTRPRYDLEAAVTAPSENSGRGTELFTNVTIHVAPPLRTGTPRDITVTFTVPENLSGGKVGDILGSLRAVGVRVPRDPRFQLVSPESKESFTLDDEGILYTVSPLDYETKDSHTLVVVSGRTSMIFYVVVQVEDLNDNPPQFNAVRYEGTIRENVSPGTTVTLTPHIQVTDMDSYIGSSWTITIIGDSSNLFSFRKESNAIVVTGKQIDRESKSSYNLVLKAKDDGNLTSLANLTITVLDENDNEPMFLQRSDLFDPRFEYEKATFRAINIPSNIWDMTLDEETVLRIPESLPVGSRITQVMANDNDIGSFGKIEYDIVGQVLSNGSANKSSKLAPARSEDFAIEPKTGSVLVAKRLIPDSFYLLNVTATDGGGLQSMTSIPVSVYDVNDHAPKFSQPTYGFEVLEGEYELAAVGQIGAKDDDKGENGRLIYSIETPDLDTEGALPFPFRIVESSGMILISGVLDREIKDKYEFLVKVVDGGIPSLTDTAEIHIFVEDVNDHPPEFLDYQEFASIPDGDINKIPIYRATISEDSPPGSIITQVHAQDLDKTSSGSGLILYKLQNASSSLAIDSQDGTVYTIGRLDYETDPVLQATIVARDMADTPLSSTSLITVLVEDVEKELSVRVFPQELYEVHTVENGEVPQRLARIQLSPQMTKEKNFHLRLVDPAMLSIVHLDPLSGDLLLIKALDREEKPFYKFKIRAMEARKGRSLTPVTYYDLKRNNANASNSLEKSTNGTDEVIIVTVKGEMSSSKRSSNSSGLMRGEYESDAVSFSTEKEDVVEELALDEAWIQLVVNDLNDNSPKFVPFEEPIVAAVSSDAMFGESVTKVLATDPDEGINGEVRYYLLPTTISSRSISYFALDTVSGELKVAGDLSEIVGEMVSFDIKATDRRGEDSGMSSKISSFIHVLDQSSQLIVELNAPPKEINHHFHTLQRTLSNISGFDIRIQKITPHVEGDLATILKTDVFIYGVDPLTKELIRSSRVRNSLRNRHHKLSLLLPNDISMKGIRAPMPQATGKLLKSAELAILVGALVVFLACVSSIVCLCYRQRKSRRKPMPLPPGLSFGLPAPANGVPILPLPYGAHYPAPYTHMSDHSDSSESTHLTSPDHIHQHQLMERNPRHLPPPRNPRLSDSQHIRGSRSTDDDNWHWQNRSRHNSLDNLTEEEEDCTHNCRHSSPHPQQLGSKGSHWHVRDSGSDPDDNYSRPGGNIHSGSNNNTHNRCCNKGCSRAQGNHACCGGQVRAPSPDNSVRTQRSVDPGPSTSTVSAQVKKVHGRIASDVTEL